jgi:triacylglycerol lipase
VPSRAYLIVAVLGALLLVVVVAVVVLYLRRRRRRARLRRAVGPRLPLVLAHGLLGFDSVGVWPITRHYFNGVPARLAADGCQVHRTRVAPLGSIERRAEQLAAQIGTLDARRVSIIAHSMGGLDARYAISRLGLAEQVAVLVTVATPHLGTPLAGRSDGSAGARLGQLLDRLGAEAIADLTPAHLATFNEQVPDVRGVEYLCVVAAAASASDVHPMLRPSYRWLLEHAGPNDGLVPAASQRWGEIVLELEADHWAQIGWGRRPVALELYPQLARELRARGY